MPEQPAWASRISDIEIELDCLSSDLVSSNSLQVLLSVSPRAAQEILHPIATVTQGRKKLATKDAVLRRLKELAGIDPAAELQRQKKFAGWLGKQAEELKTTPRLMLEAPLAITASQLDSIPGLELGCGFLRLSFRTPQEAMLKLLALSKAMANDLEGFEERVKCPE